MAAWWNQMKKWKWVIAIFLFFLLLTATIFILMKLNIVHQATMGFQSVLFWGFAGLTFVFFGILWVVSSPNTPRMLLLLGLSVTTMGLYGAMFSSILPYVLVGMALIITSGIPALRKFKLIFLIDFPLYYLIGCIFFGFFEFGLFMIHAIGFGLAVLGLYFPNKKVNYAISSGALVIPSIAFLLLAGLFVSDLAGAEPAIRGELSSPFEDHLLYEQKTVRAFIDTNYELRIYLPMDLGFYREIGSYSTEAYIPDLTPSDFEWESVDANTYRLHFYQYEGAMQYVLTVNL